MLLASLAASFAYSTDVLFGKMALDEMPMYLFIFVVSCCYMVLALIMFIWKPKYISNYVSERKNHKAILYAIIAIIIGTLIGDALMWYAVKTSSRAHLPLAIAVIHTAPILSLILVCMFYKECMNWKANFGIVLMVVGGCLAIFYSGASSVKRIV